MRGMEDVGIAQGREEVALGNGGGHGNDCGIEACYLRFDNCGISW